MDFQPYLKVHTLVSVHLKGRMTNLMWWRRFIDLLKFETRPSCLPNFGTANGYPLSFLQKITKTKKPSTSSTIAKPTIECKSSFTICQSPSRTTSPLPTTTRHTCCFNRLHLVRPTSRLNKMNWFTVFPVNSVKSTSARLEDLCKTESEKHPTCPRQTSAVSEHANHTGHNPFWKEVKFVDRDPHWYTRRVK